MPLDLSSTLRLNDTLSTNSELFDAAETQIVGSQDQPQDDPTSMSSTDSLVNGLGDLSKVLQYLSSFVSTTTPGSSSSANPPAHDKRVLANLEYTSDGATYATKAKETRKSLQWRDEVTDGVLTDFAPEDTDSDDKHVRTPAQRKKLAKGKSVPKRAKKMRSRTTSDLDSETDLPLRRNPARKASLHRIEPTPAVASSSKNQSKADRTRSTLQQYMSDQYDYKPSHSQGKSGNQASEVQRPSRDKIVAAPETIQTPIIHATPDTCVPKSDMDETPSKKKEWPVSNPCSFKAKSFVPSTVVPPPPKSKRSDIAVKASAEMSPHILNSALKRPAVIEPIHRHWELLNKLMHDFPSDCGSLIRPANLTTHSNDPAGIHVFVDASNIFIGFQYHLKQARGIAASAHVSKANMSFDSLALLMERRRPVAKRVLCGSTPKVSAFDVADAIGYECRILDKVKKARQLTPRQRYFLKSRSRRTSSSHAEGAPDINSSSDSGMASSSVPTHAPERMVEQGVDEIIHLDMLLSLNDTKHPATMVLATGDAAQAEYSEGFMSMVERALVKGWKVELVSWSQNTSQSYRRDAFTKRWGENFRVIELDDYALELWET